MSLMNRCNSNISIDPEISGVDRVESPVIRPMQQADIDAVHVIEHASFTIPWTKAMLEDELYNCQACYRIIEIGGEVCGYLGMWKICDEGHITNIAVHPDHRRKGLAKLLLDDMISYSRQEGITALTLEVRVGNHAAIALYQHMGFRVEGRRKRYYSDNHEDALIMWLRL